MNMKLKASLFVAACMLLLLVPSVGMLIHPTTETTENKRMAEFPEIVTEGSVNTDFFQEFETYFNQHMAFRNRFLSWDARILHQGFQESNVSGVIAGAEDWLYYSSTLDDYQGKSRLSERQLGALAWNLSVVDDYLEQQGCEVLMMIAPNKNSLYGQYMPYYTQPAAPLEEHNAVRLAPLLAEYEVHYSDLFSLLSQQKGILYQKKDSHWNDVGAMLVYDQSMNQLQKDHSVYPATGLVSHRDGDLNKMLFSFYGEEEMVPSFMVPVEYEVTTQDATVESGWMATANPEGEGTLLMFRDSFANTLIPLYSNVYAEAYYSKGQPHMLEMYLEKYHPDTVIIEKVERNIKDYLNAPPILSAPVAQSPDQFTLLLQKQSLNIQVEPLEYNPGYVAITGSIPKKVQSARGEYVIVIHDIPRKAYQLADGSFLLYLKADDVAETEDIQVYVKADDQWYLVTERP